MFTRKFSEEHRKRISEAKKGKQLSPQHRKKISEGLKKAWQNIPCCDLNSHINNLINLRNEKQLL